jgi:hypothetical protein
LRDLPFDLLFHPTTSPSFSRRSTAITLLQSQIDTHPARSRFFIAVSNVSATPFSPR